MAVNERIMATTYDSAIKLHQQGVLKRIIVMSSSMVYGNTTTFPTPEDDVKSCSVPESTYGFQKLAAEYFAKGAWIQYKVPYSIVRPFNCVGIGEEKAKDVRDSNDINDELTLSHVLPDLVVRIMKGQDPLTILGTGQQIRCYTHGKDIARGIRMVLESPNAELEDFNISTSRPTSVLELAKLIWNKLRPDEEFRYVSVPSFDDDVQKRIPDVSKAKELLGFEAEVDLEDSVNEVIEYVRSKNESK
jgi:nucleoside-diphosphate-sugar epimerase